MRAESAAIVREPRLAEIEHRIAVVQATIASVRVLTRGRFHRRTSNRRRATCVKRLFAPSGVETTRR